MAPLTLSQVPAATPYIQYVATNGQTVFPYPFAITQDSDLVCVLNGAAQATDSGYTLSGQGNPTGGNLTFTSGRTAGDIVTLYRNVAIQRISQIAQNSGYSSTVFNAEYNQVYLIAQQLQSQIGFALQVPNTNTPSGGGNILTPAAYANKGLSFDANGNPQPFALTASALTQSTFNSFLNNVTFAGASGDSYSDAYLKRTANYSGGTPGHVATCATFETDVTGTGATNYEWTVLGIMNNSATAGQNVAGYFQGNRVTSGAGPTWAAVCEARELVAINDPTTGLVSLEVDNRSNGTDAYGNRIGIDVVVTRYNGSGPATTINSGYRVQTGSDASVTINHGFLCQVAGALGVGYAIGVGGGGSTVQHGFYIGSGATLTGAIVMADTSTQAVWGCDFGNATLTSGAMRMKQNAPICFEINGYTALYWDTARLRFDYGTSGRTQQWAVTNAGAMTCAAGLGIYGNAAAAQSTGWGTPTGGGVIANLAGSGDTLAHIGQAVSQLIIVLKAVGILAA